MEVLVYWDVVTIDSRAKFSIIDYFEKKTDFLYMYFIPSEQRYHIYSSEEYEARVVDIKVPDAKMKRYMAFKRNSTKRKLSGNNGICLGTENSEMRGYSKYLVIYECIESFDGSEERKVYFSSPEMFKDKYPDEASFVDEEINRLSSGSRPRYRTIKRNPDKLGRLATNKYS